MDDTLSESDFIRLYTSHEVRLRAFALSLIANWADAEEVLQEANVVIWRKRGEFRPGTSFFSWAARVVHLTAKDFRKRRAREKIQFDDRFYEAVAEETERSAEELTERERLLSECVGKLKPRARQIVSLRYHDGLDVAQVGAAVGSSAGAIYDALGRIYRQLFECVERGLARSSRA